MKKTLRRIFIVLLLIILLLCGCVYYAFDSLGPKSKKEEYVTFKIENNQYAKTVLNNLAKEGIINDPITAYYYAKFTNNYNYKAGTYQISKSWDLKTIMNFISDANNAEQQVVQVKIVEGATSMLKNIANSVAAETNLEAWELMEYWDDYNSVKELIDDYDVLTYDILDDEIRHYLEGYLFPDTYEFFYESTPEQVTRKMLDRTESVYHKYQDEFNRSDMSIHEIMTLASVVEWESSTYDEMRRIAGVFLNRLNSDDWDGLPYHLQSSVTVCYTIDLDLDDDWRACELGENAQIDSPYNTYVHEGLPVGPILAPSENAIKATLNHEENPYFYFYGAPDGKVYYAETYYEHLRNCEAIPW